MPITPTAEAVARQALLAKAAGRQLAGIRPDLKNQALRAQADPIGEVLETIQRPNGARIEKVRVPLGVVAMIYESRPNVTADAAALCLKSGNAVLLRGGSEAINS